MNAEKGSGVRFKLIDELEPTDKILIAYHAHCIDGFTSAWACWRGLLGTTSILADNIELMEMSYGELIGVKANAHMYKRIYFVDFSIPIDTLLCVSSVTEVVILDHHKTAFEMYADWLDISGSLSAFSITKDSVRIIMDMNECGASLVWKHFFTPAPLPMLIHYVRDYDLWRFELLTAKGVNKYLRVQEKTVTNWNYLESRFSLQNGLRAIRDLGVAMQLYHDSIVQDLVTQSEPCVLDGDQGLCVNCSSQFASDVGHELATKSGTYGATWQQEPNGKVKWSVRSNGIYDVAAIAAKFGGGGHKNAAGFVLKTPQEDVTRLGITLWAK